MNKYSAIVIGMSAGGLDVLMQLFVNLKDSFPMPVILVQHLHPESMSELPDILSRYTGMKVKECTANVKIDSGTIYTAPANYHILIERDKTISLSCEEKVNYSRPSIDMLFESAAYVWTGELIGILLTGANNDGAAGMRKIKELGGLTIAENPQTAEYPTMPQSAIDNGGVDLILNIEEIQNFLENLYII
jgi:two-component system, chemotaxis family, protein-glutamate methylesterase/glutaminase